MDRFVWTRVAVLVVACSATGCAVEIDVGVGGAGAELRRFCGGIAGFPCPEGFVCVDDRRDDCDPDEGGADCGGVCRREPRGACHRDRDRIYVSRDPDVCATVRFVCEVGQQAFFDHCGCGCEPAPLEQCGTVTCGPGLVCCNASCGICTPPDGFCIQIACEPEVGVPCGPNTCAVGEVCCNASCGICTPPDGFCTQQFCGPEL